jgi:extracellular factor (EF) 3-hydroxypalmitic acid methyl ester biosynthesis protein
MPLQSVKHNIVCRCDETLPWTGAPAPDEIAKTAERLLIDGRVAEGLDFLYRGLDWCRISLPPDRWREYCRTVRREGVLMDLLLQSPFTQRAYRKPRGYPGDAVLIDYIYGCADCLEDDSVSEPGRQIFSWEYESPGCRSVRARRQVLASALDAAARRPDARVLAIACGHLREVELSSAASGGAFETYIAADHDEASLAEVDRCYAPLGVSTLTASARSLIARRHTLSDFDLVYVPGLYDYLPARAAEALTSVLFDMLRPGGALLIGSCTPDRRDIGYMQAIMDWRLIYRDEPEMLSLSRRIDPVRVGAATTFREPHQNIVFLELTRA